MPAAGRTASGSRGRSAGGGGAQPLDFHAVVAVHLGQPDEDPFVPSSWHVLADVVRADRQLAVAAIDEDRQSDGAGPTQADQRVKCSPNGPTRVQDVVDQNHGPPVQVEVELGVAHDGLRAAWCLAAADVDVVAVERDVELSEVQLEVGALRDQPAQAVRERDTAGVDPDERGGLELLVALDDLVRDPRECAADGVAVSFSAAVDDVGEALAEFLDPARAVDEPPTAARTRVVAR